MKGMEGLLEWYEAHSGTYDPTTVIVELGNPFSYSRDVFHLQMVIQEIQLKECYWLDTEGNTAETASF